MAITNEPGFAARARPRPRDRLRTGPERSVAATKTYTASLGAGRGRRRRRRSWRDPGRDGAPVRRGRCRSPPPRDGSGWPSSGRGVAYGTAFEAALKLSELTGVVAAPWSSADFMHGPIAIVEPGFPVLAIAPSGPTAQGCASCWRRPVTRCGGDGDRRRLDRRTPDRAEAVPEWLWPLVSVIGAQLLAVGAAEELGRDVDRPTGLKKVTLTS